MADEKKKVPVPKTLWIKCRASEKCEGNQAEIIMQRAQKPMGRAGGAFNLAERAGKLIRYRCTTCKGIFQIGQ
jgi:hypothetical protein